MGLWTYFVHERVNWTKEQWKEWYDLFTGALRFIYRDKL